MGGDSIYKDVIETLSTLETQCHSDKVQTLTLLLNKYQHLNKVDHLMDYHDLQSIVNQSKKILESMSCPKFLKSGILTKRIEQGDQIHLALAEATINRINRLDCLKRLPRFDYRENKF